MKFSTPLRLSGLLAALLLTACATSVTQQRPVLYPNAAYKALGESAAQQHLDHCLTLASQSGLQPGTNAAASGATQSGVVAGVAGAVGSAVFGGNLSDALKRGAQSAVVGAAAGGAAGAVSERANTTYRQFVQRCAAEKGLDVIGWN